MTLAIVAFAPRAADRDPGRLAAIAAERVVLVPVQQALGLAQRADDVGRDQPLGGDGAQVDERQVAALLRVVVRGRLDQPREQRAVAVAAEEHAVGGVAERLGLLESEQRVVRVAVELQCRDLAREDHAARGRGGAQPLEEGMVLALTGHAVERVEGEAGGLGPIEQGCLRTRLAPAPTGYPALVMGRVASVHCRGRSRPTMDLEADRSRPILSPSIDLRRDSR